jgi:hypothetical protein
MYWWQSVEDALKNLNGSARLETIYEEVRRVRANSGDTLPPSLEAVVRKELEYNSSDSSNWHQARNLFYSVDGIGNGHWGLRSMLVPPPIASDIEEPTDDTGTKRGEVTTYRIIRDTEMARKIKVLHGNQCQICGHGIKLPSGLLYVEAHHVIPLGQPHSGPDVASNIIVVCPNHHAMLDFGCMRIDRTALKAVAGHYISEASITYHNTNIVD